MYADDVYFIAKLLPTPSPPYLCALLSFVLEATGHSKVTYSSVTLNASSILNHGGHTAVWLLLMVQ